MTQAEIRAMLRRSDPMQLREDAGISRSTVARALGVTNIYVQRWETRVYRPWCAAGFRWARFTAALERRAEVTAQIAAEGQQAA